MTTVGDLKAMLEFIPDDTKIYIADEGYDAVGDKVCVDPVGWLTYEFIESDGYFVHQVADDNELVTQEIGLVVW